MIFAGVVCLFCCTIPETFAPVLLRRRAAQLREQTGNPNITTEQELFKVSLSQLLVETLFRPFRESLYIDRCRACVDNPCRDAGD